MSDSEEGMVGMVRQRSNSAPTVMRNVDDAEELDLEEDEATAGDRPSTTSSGMKRRANSEKKRSITVLTRFRPENAQEVANGGETCVEYHHDNKSVTLTNSSGHGDQDKYQFFFHHCFQSFATQDDIHGFVGEPVSEAFTSGINCSVLAYGQTGSGKTYTMMGVMDAQGRVVEAQGLIPRIFTNVFRMIQEKEDTHVIELQINFVELYMEKLNDLLSRGGGTTKGAGYRMGPHGQPVPDEEMKIHAMPDGTTTITNCTSVVVGSLTDALAMIQRGLMRRTTACTKSNAASSRSHAILILTLCTKCRETKMVTNSQLYLVDLAGSEMVSKTEADGLRLDEAKSINQSLFSLGQVVTSLSSKRRKGQPKSFVPYRDSKLTRLLENSLGGNAVTYMVVTCSPSSWNERETLSTLRFGTKAQLILTKPVKNQYRTVEELEFLLRKAKEEIEMQRSTIALMKNQMKSVRATDRNVVNSKLGKGAGLMQCVLESRFSSILGSVCLCPLSQKQMKDPVVALDGFTYERRSIVGHLMNENNNLCSPMTGERINATLMIPNLLVKSLFELSRDAGISFGTADLEDYAGTAPVSPFLVCDILSVVVGWMPLSDVLSYARVNTYFARVCYDKDLWKDAINNLLQGVTASRKQSILSLQLPAHKVYLALKTGGEDSTMKLDKLQYSSGTALTLYSSGLRNSK